jgi:hypothetical protein
MAMVNLSPEWIIGHLSSDLPGEDGHRDAPRLVRQLAEPLRKQVAGEGEIVESGVTGGMDAALLHQVLLDDMASMLALAGVAGSRMAPQTDRHDASRSLLYQDVLRRGSFVPSRNPQWLHIAPVSNGCLVDILSKSSPLGP